MKKKMLCVALSLCMVMCLSPSLSFAADGVNISATFEDENFRSYVSQNFDSNHDGYLNQSEIAAVTIIDCADKNIASLAGIEVFTNLKELNCSGNILTALDVSQNADLEVLNCAATYREEMEGNLYSAGDLTGYKNCISSLNLSKNTRLKTLNCDWNELDSLDVSNNTELISLSCRGCRLTSLDVSYNTNLEELFCGDYWVGPNYNFCNELEELNLGGNTSLKKLDIRALGNLTSIIGDQEDLSYLSCAHCNLSSLDVSKFKNLEYLDCSWNDLTVLNLEKNLKLKYLDCSGHENKLSTIDLQNHNQLEHLNCSRNGAQSLKLSNTAPLKYLDCWGNNIEELDVSSYSELEFLSCGSSKIKELNLKNNKELKELECSFGDISSLDVSENTKLEHLRCYATKIDKLDVSKNSELKYLDCSGSNISSLDVSKNTNLEELHCGETKITELDVSKNTKLDSLSYDETEINTLDVSQNGELSYLRCNDSNISSLDVSKNTKLESLYCYNTKITELDVSKNTKLGWLHCENTEIDELDVSKNSELRYLRCSYNDISSLDVSKNTKLGYLFCKGTEIDELDVSKNSVLYSLDCSETRITSLDVSNNTELNTERILYSDWDIENVLFACGDVDSKGWGYWLDEPTTTIDLSKLPGTFDPEKASNWEPNTCTLEGSILTIPEGTDRVSYTYDCGNGKSGTFVLRIHMHPENVTEWVSNGNGTHTRTCTCTDEGDTRYTKTEKCSGGQATTTAKAVCSVCGGEYGWYVTRLANITGADVSAKAGKEITVPIRLTKNTGLASMQIEIGFDDSVLELTGVTNGEIFPDAGFVAPELDKSNVLSWQNSKIGNNITSTGVLANLTFTIKKDAKVGNTKITYTCSADNEDAVDANGKVVTVSSDDSVVSIIAFVYGDVDDDGSEVGLADVMQLRRYVAKWKGYTVNTDAADLDCNGKISIRDITILERYIAGWKGYENLPIKKSSLPIDDTKAE